MEPFRIHILGCGSALPTLRHNASAQVVDAGGKLFVVDCGEGTQTLLRRSKLKFTKVTAVFISHLHGDHCFGLIGMISTFGMLGRTVPLHVFAPAAFESILLGQMDFFCKGLEYEVIFHAIDTTANRMVYEDRRLSVETIPLCHRTPCCGYLFREKQPLPHINKEMADFHKVPVSQYNNIKNGQDWTDSEGNVVPWKSLTIPPQPPRSYAYCSDTAYLPELYKLVKGVDVLYHESTYASCDEQLAHTYMHSTARQAAKVALDANAGRLLLGHYSARYDSEEVLLEEAKEIFPNSILSQEGIIINV